MYLLDTNVVSELRRTKPHGAVLSWFSRVADSDLHLSVVTIGEIQAGIEIAQEYDPTKAAEISAWLDRFTNTYNILPMEGRIFRCYARLMHRRSDNLAEDAMIAATAIVHQLIVVTRNVTDFAQFGVKIFDPFQSEA